VDTASYSRGHESLPRMYFEVIVGFQKSRISSSKFCKELNENFHLVSSPWLKSRSEYGGNEGHKLTDFCKNLREYGCLVFIDLLRIIICKPISCTMKPVYTSVRPSVHLYTWNNSAPTGRIFMKFDIWRVFLSNLSRQFKFHCNLITVTGTLH